MYYSRDDLAHEKKENKKAIVVVYVVVVKEEEFFLTSFSSFSDEFSFASKSKMGMFRVFCGSLSFFF